MEFINVPDNAIMYSLILVADFQLMHLIAESVNYLREVIIILEGLKEGQKDLEHVYIWMQHVQDLIETGIKLKVVFILGP